jgi:hypothetical protein
MSDNVVPFKRNEFVRFYDDYIECDFCGQQTRGRVYEGSQKIQCGACAAVFFEFETEEERITVTLEELFEMAACTKDFDGDDDGENK